ncbi:hypothetical protein [Belnapia rosea]|uniref:Lipoprotein n=1 Tax=Belnapia rosea TaxID=938405 RepID=A0A1G6JT50_9PROT|nr:hypothetical protein [Belnapia rosea]SDC21930.1 hypothetical protein SAMN04487779_1001270 [Belnapia rosea]
MPGHALAVLSLAFLALAACSPPPPVRNAAEASARGGCEVPVQVVNASSRTVDRLFLARLSQEGWGTDRLGQEVLRPGRSASYRASVPGAQDLRVVWADGRAAELRRIDPCATGTIRVEDGGLRAG